MQKDYKYILAILLLFTLNLQVVFGQIKPRVQSAEHAHKSSAKAGDFIDVNVAPYPESNFSITQLVTDVLVGDVGSCVTPQITNVTISPNTAVSDNNRAWGYFNKGTANFPFEEGIVLSTGFARNAGNQLAGFGDDGNGNALTPSNTDTDLAAAIGVSAGNLNDAVALEFDFVPTSTQMKFNYIFASEEYTGTFPCSYTDGFALLLRPAGGTYTNLALLPAGAGAVSVTNVRPSTTYAGANLYCGAQNDLYFGGYNNPIIGHNFNGTVIPLTAQATVVPGQTYHIKMVLADATDTSYDSAVFLEAGSFDIGVQILDPTGVAIDEDIEMCDNEPQMLTASVQIPGVGYQWFLDGVAITGATSASYSATLPGTYKVEVYVPGNPCPGEAEVVVLGGNAPIVNNVTYTQCYTPGAATFDLTLAEPQISATPGATYTYYLDPNDAADQNDNFIVNPTNHLSGGNQTIYVLVKSGFCPAIAELELVKADEIEAIIATPEQITCSTPEIYLDASNSVYPAGAVFSWEATNGGYVVSGGNTLTPIVNSAGTYTLTITMAYQPGDIVCTDTVSVGVSEDTNPPLVQVESPKMTICYGESTTLIAAGGVSYYWPSTNLTGNTITVSPTTTTTYQVYSIGANGCMSEDPAEITITVIPEIVSTLPQIAGQICDGDEITLDAGYDSTYTYVWNYIDPVDGSVQIGTEQTVVVNQPGEYTVTIDNGICTRTFTTEVIQAQVPQVIDALYEEGGVLTVTASNPSNGALEYSIDNGFTWQDSNVFYNVESNVNITISVRVKRTSCFSSMEFFTFLMLNAITPNGDGVNDVIDFRGVSNYNNFGATVFDRYGKILYNGNKDNPIWDGKYNGRSLPTATYWYEVHFEHPASKIMFQKTGWILLKNFE